MILHTSEMNNHAVKCTVYETFKFCKKMWRQIWGKVVWTV